MIEMAKGEGIIYWQPTIAILYIVVMSILSVFSFGLLGNLVTHSTGGTIVGAIVGGLLCHHYLMKNMVKK